MTNLSLSPAAAIKQRILSMTAPAPASDFGRSFSLEATRPGTKEVATLASILPAGTEVYFTAVPTVGRAEIIAGAAALRKAGLEPVVHIAARRLPDAAYLTELLTGLRDEAAVRRLLVIGGDVDATGPFTDALAVILKGRLREFGIEEIGIGGYPEGHPSIQPGRLEAARYTRWTRAAEPSPSCTHLTTPRMAPIHRLASPRSVMGSCMVPPNLAGRLSGLSSARRSLSPREAELLQLFAAEACDQLQLHRLRLQQWLRRMRC
jgi:hypothetical protein